LAGRYPRILEDSVVGKQATDLFKDALEMLEKIIEEKWLTAKGVYGFWEANSNGDDILLKEDGVDFAQFQMMRQQTEKAKGAPNYSLADFIAPMQSTKKDYIGGFAVTTGLGIESKIQEFEENIDDYNSILLKALADRLAEAFAEMLHAKVRKQFWGYSADENFENDDLIKEKYQGIRPAPGYPACPDHTEKPELFRILKATENTGIELTENFAMSPAAAVCGWYFSHPQSRYFGIQKILQDQAQSLADRKNKSLEEMSRWLSPYLD